MQKYIYCISCRANSDAIVAKTIEQTLHVRAVCLSFDREEHRKGQWVVKTYPLLWGYVFLYADQPVDIMWIYQIEYRCFIFQMVPRRDMLNGNCCWKTNGC